MFTLFNADVECEIDSYETKNFTVSDDDDDDGVVVVVKGGVYFATANFFMKLYN